MSDLLTAVNRLATPSEVVDKRVELRSLAERQGFGAAALAEDGTLIVHNDEPGYRRIAKRPAIV